MRLASLRHRHVTRYAAALAVMAGTAGVLYLLREALEPPAIVLLYLLPVGLGTAVWGLGPGVASALVAFLTFNYLFIPPFYTLAVQHSGDVVVLAVFLLVAFAISQLVGRARAGLLASVDREREATQLYEFTTALTGVQDSPAIAQVVAARCRDVFRAQVARVSVAGLEDLQVGDSGEPLAGGRLEMLTMPMESARGRAGAIQLWRAGDPFSHTEHRLLQTFASQAALALERAGLAQADTRARVLEESDRLKTALLSSVSHELRTPLATIKAAATSLHSGEVGWDSAVRQDLLSVLVDETDRLNRLVGNLLDMSRIEAGALHPKREWNLLSEIVGSLVARMGHAFASHRVEIDVPEDLPLVPVDYVLIEEVFANLLSNCVKYAPPGTTIGVRARAPDDSQVQVSIRNQGPPVPAEHLDRIFDKFYRVTAADRVTGTGLGLSICKGIIEAHGGRIWAENLAHGLEFHFTLPLRGDDLPPRLSIQPESG